MMKFVLVTKRRTRLNVTWERRPVLRGTRYVSRKRDPVVCVIMESLLIRNENVWEGFTWVSNVIRICFGLVLLLWWIDVKISRHFLIQSDVKSKPIVPCSHSFSRASRLPHVIWLGFWLVQWNGPFWLARVNTFLLPHSSENFSKNVVHLDPFSFFLKVLFSTVYLEFFKTVKAPLQLWLCYTVLYGPILPDESQD